MKVPFKMPEIFSHTLGGGLEIWASIETKQRSLKYINHALSL